MSSGVARGIRTEWTQDLHEVFLLEKDERGAVQALEGLDRMIVAEGGREVGPEGEWAIRPPDGLARPGDQL